MCVWLESFIANKNNDFIFFFAVRRLIGEMHFIHNKYNIPVRANDRNSDTHLFIGKRKYTDRILE
jgi:hypothetical protein